MRETVNADGAATVGPYSHGVITTGAPLVFISGQTPLVPGQTEVDTSKGAGWQTEQCFKNLFAVLEQAGLAPADVVKCNVYLTSMDDYEEMNQVYGQQFEKPFPARTTVQVAGLPLDARVEIELIAQTAVPA